MELKQKLLKLIGQEDQVKIARAAGIAPTALSAYVNGRGKPSADAAVGLAKALACDLAWLLDDSRAWEDRAPASLNEVPDEMLVQEVRRRYVQAAIEYRETIERAAQVDWRKMATLLFEAPERVIPPEVQEAIDVHFALIKEGSRWGTLAGVLLFTPWGINADIPNEIDPGWIKPDAIRAADDSLKDLNSSFIAFIEVMGIKAMENSGRYEPQEIARRRAEAQLLLAKNKRPIKKH